MARSGVNRDQPGFRLQATGSWPDSRPQRRRFKRRASASSTLQRGRAIAETIETPSAPSTRRVLSTKTRKLRDLGALGVLNPSRRPAPSTQRGLQEGLEDSADSARSALKPSPRPLPPYPLLADWRPSPDVPRRRMR